MSTTRAIEGMVSNRQFDETGYGNACVGVYPSQCNGSWNATSGIFYDFLVSQLGTFTGTFAPDTSLRSGGISVAKHISTIRIAIYVGADSTRCDDYQLDRNNWNYFYTSNSTWQGACIVTIPY